MMKAASSEERERVDQLWIQESEERRRRAANGEKKATRCKKEEEGEALQVDQSGFRGWRRKRRRRSEL